MNVAPGPTSLAQALLAEELPRRWIHVQGVGAKAVELTSVVGASNAQLLVDAAVEGLRPPMAPYGLRHTAITLQSKQGYSDWELADWGGTSERMINEVYRHRTERVTRVRPIDLSDEN